MESAEIVVIGAGVIGLAVARELSLQGRGPVYILEKNRKAGQEISSRNSEVIHSGLYYPQTMLKSRLCVEGRQLLYEYCRENRVPFQNCGKLLIACTLEEHLELERLAEQARINGVRCRWVEQEELTVMEPDILAVEALFFPDSGTVDAHSLVKSLQFAACDQGASLVLDCEISAVEWDGDYYHLRSGKETITARQVVNAAGLGSERIAAALGIDTDLAGYRLHPCKGEYFKVKNRFDVKHLVYPVPTDKSLGIHLSFDLSGNLRLGPSAEYVDHLDYSVDESKSEGFFRAAHRYIRDLHPEDISPDFAGIRPKLQAPGESMRDFIITEESRRGYPGWINLIGIESPGLTSCLAIARYVANLI